MRNDQSKISSALRLEELEELVAVEPDLTMRLRSALELMEHAKTDAVRLMASVEAATCLLHLGMPGRSFSIARSIRRTAEFSGSRHDQQASLLVQGMALYQLAARSQPHASMPGLHIVKALERGAEDFTPFFKSSALNFVGSWHGIYGSKELALTSLEISRNSAEEVRDEVGAVEYLSFLADFRIAEATAEDERQLWISKAEIWLPELHPRHVRLGRELLEALRRGDDCSIRSDFKDTPASSQ